MSRLSFFAVAGMFAGLAGGFDAPLPPIPRDLDVRGTPRATRGIPGRRHGGKTHPPPIPTTERPSDPASAARWEAARAKRARRAMKQRLTVKHHPPAGRTITIGQLMSGTYTIDCHTFGDNPTQVAKMATWADMHGLLDIIAALNLAEQIIPVRIPAHEVAVSWVCVVTIYCNTQARRLAGLDALTVLAASRDPVPLQPLLRGFLNRLAAKPNLNDPCPFNGSFTIKAPVP